MRVVWGWVWCKQRNSGKDRRLNNEQWSRIEQVTLVRACIESPGPGHVLCGNTAWSHSGSHRPRARKVGADGREHWKLWQDVVVIHGNVTRNEAPCFSVSGYRWVAAGQLDSALLFTNLHIYNNWHNRHHVRHKTMPRPPGQPHQVIITQNYSVITIWWWFYGLCKLDLTNRLTWQTL